MEELPRAIFPLPSTRIPWHCPRSFISMRRNHLILLALAVLTLAAYWGVGECGFVGYDDPSYVRHNPMVNQGLRSAAVLWAFTATHGANWHPLTSLSHMLDCSLFDLDPVPPHWESLLWHILNSCLVFHVWRRFSGATWPSALVAGLFALHPLHVESVAWISERKDVLSTALWLLTTLAYLRWVEGPTARRYVGTMVLFALALMAKPMVVTLPCTLLLLDYWPLRRWPARTWRALFVEKIPFFALVVVHAGVTMLVQRALGATDYGEKFPLMMRFGNAMISYARYLGKMVWPQTLSPFYPHPGWWPWAAVIGAFTLVALLSWLAWRERERRPWLTFGWCWYLGTLVPVIGVMQVGAQSMADRYTYVPLLGIFTVIAWAGAELIERRPTLRTPMAVAAGLVLAACWWRTTEQVPVWKTGLGLIQHMRQSIGEHEIVYREFATAALVAGRPAEEITAYHKRGREVAPEYPYFMNELGVKLGQAKQFDEARVLLAPILEMLPNDPAAHANFGSLCAMEGKFDEAMVHFNRSIALNPKLGGVHRLLSELQIRQGKKEEALESLKTATRCDRWDWTAWNQLAILQASMGRNVDALKSIERAHWIHPGEAGIAQNLKVLKAQNGYVNQQPPK